MPADIIKFRRRPASPPVAGHRRGSQNAPTAGGRGEGLGLMVIITATTEKFAAVRGPLSTARFLEQLAATYRQDAENPQPAETT